jgi:hypothetical protein
MKKTILLILSMIVLCTLTSAYVKPIDYHGIDLKFYNNINETGCIHMLDKVPVEYYQKLNSISIMHKNIHYKGYYFWSSKRIIIYDDYCNLTTLVRQLSIHKAKINGVNFRDLFKYDKGTRKNKLQEPYYTIEKQIWRGVENKKNRVTPLNFNQE